MIATILIAGLVGLIAVFANGVFASVEDQLPGDSIIRMAGSHCLINRAVG